MTTESTPEKLVVNWRICSLDGPEKGGLDYSVLYYNHEVTVRMKSECKHLPHLFDVWARSVSIVNPGALLHFSLADTQTHVVPYTWDAGLCSALQKYWYLLYILSHYCKAEGKRQSFFCFVNNVLKVWNNGMHFHYSHLCLYILLQMQLQVFWLCLPSLHVTLLTISLWQIGFLPVLFLCLAQFILTCDELHPLLLKQSKITA